MPCDLSEMPGPLYDGTTYLTDPSAPPVLTLPSLSISGWFLLRGYSNLFYTIYSIEESPDLLYALSYNPCTQKIQHEIVNETPIQEDSENLTLTEWLFIFSSIEYQTAPDGTQVITKIYKNRGVSGAIYPKTMKNTLSRGSNYLISAIKFNVGYFNSPASGAPACSYLKYFSAFNEKITSNQIKNFRFDIQAMSTKLLWHLDTYYTNQNLGKIFSLDDSENAQQFTSKIEDPFDFQKGVEFNLDSINASESLGFTIQFSFIMEASIPEATRIITILASKKVFTLSTFGSNELFLNSEKISCFTFNQWNHIILIIQQGAQSSILLTANGMAPDRIYLSFQRVRTVHVKFGLKTNKEIFKINPIRVYQGIQFIETDSCHFAIKSVISTQCLLCKSGYLVSLQDNSQCVETPPASSDAIFPFQNEWSPLRFQCQAGMIHDRTTGTCRCRVQEYLDSKNSCKPCPRYCNTCKSPSGACPTTSDLNRISTTGECQTGTFDDGFNCIIESQQNQLFPADKPIYFYQFSSNLAEFDISMDLVTDTNFLFTFSFLPSGITTYSKHVISKVIYNNIEIITVYLTTKSEGLNVSFLINGTLCWEQLILSNLNSWFSIWTNGSSETVFSIHSNWIITHKKITNLPITAPPIDPKICIGSCSSQYTGFQPSLGIVNTKPFSFIAGTQPPINFANQITKLLLDESQIFAIFQLELKVYSNSKLGIYYSTSDYPGQILNFKQTAADLSKVLRGFGFSNYEAEAIYELKNLKFPPSISMSVYIFRVFSQVTLLWYKFTEDITIEYYIIPFEQSRTAAMRICVQYICKDTINARLYLGESNFLSIFTIDQSPFQIDFLRLAFHVTCNYFNEELYFYIPRPKEADITLTQINFFNQSDWIRVYLINLNRIMIINGNSYYYSDISSTTKCFMRLGFDPSGLCIQPKRNYLIFGNTIIPKSDCVPIQMSTKYRFINQNTRECIDIEMPPNCIQLDLVTTFACKVCKEGYFQKSGSFECFKCDQKCVTCSESSSNCGTCHNPYIQIAPKCDCFSEKYFLNDNFQCELCNLRCQSCSETAENCLSCSANRIYPPTCACDPSTMIETTQFIQNPYDGSTITTGKCSPIVCDIQCETCLFSPSNCITCSQNRGAPPSCACQVNSYRTTQGNCVACPSGMYMKQTDISCQKCKSPCLECSGQSTLCLSCEDDLILEGSTCRCSNSYIRIQKIDGISFICAKEIQLDSFVVSVNPKTENYVLEFRFPVQLYSINFNVTTASDYLLLSFEGVNSNIFTLENPLINEDTFSVELIPKTEFKATTGYVIFKQNIPFISSTEDFVLSHDYLLNPIQIPSIGPFFFPKSDSQASGSVSFTQATNSIKAVNPNIFSAFQGLQIIFYLFDSLQPTAFFLLVSIQYPPYLYSFLQIIGTTIFPNVLDYQAVDSTDRKTQSLTSIFSIISFEDIKVNQNSEFVFKRIGLSNSLIISIPIILIKYLIIYILIFFLKILKYSLKQKHDLWIESCEFLKKRVVSEVEVNLLISCVSVFLNFEELNGDSWASRVGFYGSIFLLIINMFVIGNLASQTQDKTLKKHSIQTNNIKQESYQTLPNKTDKQSKESQDKNIYFIILTQNLKKKRIDESRSYFFLQLCLKFLIVYLQYSYRDFPSIVCLICAGCFFLSATQTIRMKPYLSLRTRYLKLITDCIFTICWILCFQIANIESEMFGPTVSESSQIDQDLLSSYQALGDVVVYLLILTNVINILEQLFCFVEFIRIFIKERNARNQMDTPMNLFSESLHNNNVAFENYTNIKEQSKNGKEQLTASSQNKILNQLVSSKPFRSNPLLVALQKRKLTQSIQPSNIIRDNPHS